jgi:solute:Na+ symporter, SSS family
MPDFEIATIDYVIVAAYIAAIVGIGIWAGRGAKDSDSYFLGGRGTVWPLVGFALMAANLSGTSYVGLAGAGYHDGIAVWNYEWIATLVLVFFALFILPFYLRSKVSTMPEFLEKRYDRRCRYTFSAFSVFTAMFIDAAGALFAGGMVLNLIFPGAPLELLIAGMALLGGLYVILGGLKAVVVTDTIQGVLLLIAGGIIFVMLFDQLGSWQAVRDAAPEDGFTVFKPADDDFLPWPGILTGALWLGFYYWTTNHIVVQKVLSAKNVDHGRWGALFCAFLQLPLLFLLILPGTMGRALYPDLEEPDQIWPILVFDFLPTGLRGLVFAALVAALMSTLDSVLNGSASMVVNDFIKTRKREFSERMLLIMSRVMVGIFMVVAALWAPVILEFDGIVEYFQSFLGYLVMPVVTVFLGGLFWRRGGAAAAFWTLALGFPVGLAAFFAGEIFGLFDLQFLYGAGVMLLASVALYVALSLAGARPEAEKVEDFTWSRETWRRETRDLEGTPAYLNYRWLSAALVAVTVGMVAAFA